MKINTQNMSKMKPPKTILLIDDNNDDREFFIHALADLKNVATVRVADGSRNALDMLENSSWLPDLIVSDINMPLMDGIQCMVEILKCPRTGNIPVVILSSDVRRKEEAIRSGARLFIEKTTDFKKISAEIVQLINRHVADEVVSPGARVYSEFPGSAVPFSK